MSWAEKDGSGPFKRFVVLTMNQYYPQGGFADAIGSADTLEEAREVATEQLNRIKCDGHEIFDCQERMLVE